MTNVRELRASLRGWLSDPVNAQLWERLLSMTPSAGRDANLLAAAADVVSHWKAHGARSEVARAQFMLACVLARQGDGDKALEVANPAFDVVLAPGGTDWEASLGHAALACAHAASGNEMLHRHHYFQLSGGAGQMSDIQERNLLEQLLLWIPAPPELPHVALSAFERRLLGALILGDPEEKVLRQQLALVSTCQREYTGPGFFSDLDVSPEAPRCRAASRYIQETPTLYLLHPKMASGGAMSMLHFQDGLMRKLEGISVDGHEAWPEDESLFVIQPGPIWNQDPPLA